MGCSSEKEESLEVFRDYKAVLDPVLPPQADLEQTGGPPAMKRGQRPVQIRILEGVAPELTSSPSFSSWAQNAMKAARGNGRAGSPGSPDYFEDLQVTGPEVFIASEFPSWLGQRDPGQAFAPSFAQEKGNRVHFFVRIHDPSGGKVSISEGLHVGISPNYFLPNGFSFGPFARYYGFPYLFGVDYGPDRVPGTSDDVILSRFDDEADEIFFSVLGLGVMVKTQYGNALQEQLALDQAKSQISSEGFFQIASTFSFRGQTAVSRLNVNPGHR